MQQRCRHTKISDLGAIAIGVFPRSSSDPNRIIIQDVELKEGDQFTVTRRDRLGKDRYVSR
jgi:hypothetical protein